MARPRKTLRLRDARKLARLVSAARIEIVEALQMHGASTVAELAHQVGRAPDALYHHLRLLRRDGIVERHGSRRSGGRAAAVYRLSAEAIRADLDARSSPSFRRAWAAAAAAVLRTAEREVKNAAEEGRGRSSGKHATLHVRRTKVWLTRSDLARVNEHVDALQDLLREHARHPTGATPYSWTTAFAPLPDKEIEP